MTSGHPSASKPDGRRNYECSDTRPIWINTGFADYRLEHPPQLETKCLAS